MILPPKIHITAGVVIVLKMNLLQEPNIVSMLGKGNSHSMFDGVYLIWYARYHNPFFKKR
jgi:hypothetical protein